MILALKYIQYYNPDSADYGLIILGVAVGSNAYMRHRLSVKRSLH